MKKILHLMIALFALLSSAGAQNFSAISNPGKAQVSPSTGGGLLCDSIVAKDFEGKSVDKIINTYDASGNIVIKTRYLWNSFSGSWYDYTYDSNSNTLSSVYTLWDASLKVWKNNEK